MFSSMDLAACAVEALRVRLMERTKDLHWAAYVGAEAMLKASQDRERVIQDYRERACKEARDWENTAALLRAELNTERRKLELLADRSSFALLKWRESCAKEGLDFEITEPEREKLAYRYEHPRPILTVDVVVIHQGSVLLIQRGEPPFEGQWALPGGHVNIDEPTVEAAKRELLEETGVRVTNLKAVGFYDAPGRDPRGRVVSMAYGVVLPGNERPQITAGDDASDIKWLPFSEAASLSFDHDAIVRDAVRGLLW